MGMEINVDEKNRKLLEASEILKKISHPVRLAILCSLETEPLCVGDIVEKLSHISQPMISQHLSILKANRILKDSKEGQFVFYQIADERIYNLIKNLRDTFC